jgi:RNA polymerase sigma factor for flagellar operon FliA
MRILRNKPGIEKYELYTLQEMILSEENLSKWFAQLCAGMEPQVEVDEEVLAMLEGHRLIRRIGQTWALGHEGREFARKIGLLGDVGSIEMTQGDRPLGEDDSLSIDEMWGLFHKTRTSQYRDLLMEHYRDMVRDAAERLHAKLPGKVELDDLISAGIFGLMDAIDAYDPQRGVKFETYCAPRIKGAILDELRSMDWVPRLVRARAHQLGKAMHALEIRLKRKPTDEELAKELNINMEELYRLQRDADAVGLVSLNATRGDEEGDIGGYEIGVVKDVRSADPLLEAQKRDLQTLLTKGLTRAERLIIILYYYEEMTLKDIGAQLDLSESRVSQMHSSIVARLKAQLAGRRRNLDLIIREEDKSKGGERGIL